MENGGFMKNCILLLIVLIFTGTFFISCKESDDEDNRFRMQKEIQALQDENIIYNNALIQGKNGWWFYIPEGDGNNLSDFYKTNLFDVESSLVFMNKISRTAEWCKEHKIAFLFVIGPNKHSVYEEFHYLKRPQGITRCDQITKIFDVLDVPYVFSRDFLISKKDDYNVPFYSECGTHWNSLGAYLTSILLKEKIKYIFPKTKFPELAYKITNIYQSSVDNVFNLIGLPADYQTSTAVTIEPENISSALYTYIKNEDTNGVHTKGTDETLPRALVFRDSFFILLEPFVSPLFSEVEYIYKHFSDEDKEYVLQYKPDIIIFESVERWAQAIVN